MIHTRQKQINGGSAVAFRFTIKSDEDVSIKKSIVYSLEIEKEGKRQVGVCKFKAISSESVSAEVSATYDLGIKSEYFAYEKLLEEAKERGVGVILLTNKALRAYLEDLNVIRSRKGYGSEKQQRISGYLDDSLDILGYFEEYAVVSVSGCNINKSKLCKAADNLLEQMSAYRKKLNKVNRGF